jgi:phage terminase large subunit-like protein
VKQGEFAELVAGLSDAQIAALIADLPAPLAWSALDAWRLWARPEQLPPPGDWSTWVLMAGRGFGRTRAGAEWVAEQVRGPQKLQIALVAATFEEARSVMVEGNSGLREVAGPLIAKWTPSRRHILSPTARRRGSSPAPRPKAFAAPSITSPGATSWPNGRSRGRAGRCCRWAFASDRARARSSPPLRAAAACWRSCWPTRAPSRTGGSTYANPHLAASFREQMERLYGGTHLGRQELDGELISGVPGALWTAELLQACRWPEGEPVPPLTRW